MVFIGPQRGQLELHMVGPMELSLLLVGCALSAFCSACDNESLLLKKKKIMPSVFPHCFVGFTYIGFVKMPLGNSSKSPFYKWGN